MNEQPFVASSAGRVACDMNQLYLVMGDTLLALTPEFRLAGRWNHPLLKSSRGVVLHHKMLFVLSPGYDCVLRFDTSIKKFDWAVQFNRQQDQFSSRILDPEAENRLIPMNKLQLQHLYADENGLFIHGDRTGGLLHFNGETLRMWATLPGSCLAPRPFRDGIIFLDNENSALRYTGRGSSSEDRAIAFPRSSGATQKAARTRHGTSLCPLNHRAVCAGFSPPALAVYDLKTSSLMFQADLLPDEYLQTESLEVWPF